MKRPEQDGITEKVNTLIYEVEARILVGLKFPNGRSSNFQREKADRQFAAGRIAEAHELIEKNGINNFSLIDKLYFLARYVYKATPHNDYEFRISDISSEIVDKLKAIAAEGREIGKSEPEALPCKVATNKVFILVGIPHAISLLNPRAGCSAAICSNCSEPIAYCNVRCSNCKLPFIGPFGSLDINAWQKMTPSEKRILAIDLYTSKYHGRLRGANVDTLY